MYECTISFIQPPPNPYFFANRLPGSHSQPVLLDSLGLLYTWMSCIDQPVTRHAIRAPLYLSRKRPKAPKLRCISSVDSFLGASVTFGRGSASVQGYKQGLLCKLHVYGRWATDFAQLSSCYHYDIPERKKKSKGKNAKGTGG